MAEFMFLGLRMTQGVSKKEFQEYFGTAIENIYGEVLKNIRNRDCCWKKAAGYFIKRRHSCE